MLELVLRLGFSLAAVLGLFWLVAHLGSRRLGGTRALLHVRARQSLSRTASVAVVEVGDRVLVVGIADGGVRLLTELDPESLPAAPARAGAGEDAADAPARALPARSGRLTDRLAANVATRLRDRRDGTATSDAAANGTVTGGAATAGTAPDGAPDAREDSGPAGGGVRPGPTPGPAAGALSGSVLSTHTWKQAWEAATARRAAHDASATAVVFTAPSAAGTVDG